MYVLDAWCVCVSVSEWVRVWVLVSERVCVRESECVWVWVCEWEQEESWNICCLAICMGRWSVEHGCQSFLPSVPRKLDAQSGPTATLANEEQCQWGLDEIMLHACTAQNCLQVCEISWLLQSQTPTCAHCSHAHACMHACKENRYASPLFVIHCSPTPTYLPPHKTSWRGLWNIWLHCREGKHPWRLCSLYSWNFQLDNGGGSCRPCHHPCRFNEFAAKSEMWKEKPRLMCLVNVASENPCGCIAPEMLEWREMTKQIDWWAKEPTRVACCSQKIWSVEELETLPTGTKPRTSRHWLPGGERCGKP